MADDRVPGMRELGDRTWECPVCKRRAKSTSGPVCPDDLVRMEPIGPAIGEDDD